MAFQRQEKADVGGRNRQRTQASVLLPGYRIRRARIILSLCIAHGDMRYLFSIKRAQRAMLDGRWQDALQAFDRALRLYPLSPGYLEARGHAHRKLQNFAAAELDFRQALALGAPKSDLIEHIAHCAAMSGWHKSPYPSSIVWALEPEPTNTFHVGQSAFRLRLVSQDDVEAVLLALWGTAATHDALYWMRRHPDLDSLLAAVVADPKSSALLCDARSLA